MCIGFGSERARPEGGLLASRAFATPRSFETAGLRVLGDAVRIGERMPARVLVMAAADLSGEKVSESSLVMSSFISPSTLGTRDAAMAEE
jgi:hypothetical protein